MRILKIVCITLALLSVNSVMAQTVVTDANIDDLFNVNALQAGGDYVLSGVTQSRTFTIGGVNINAPLIIDGSPLPDNVTVIVQFQGTVLFQGGAAGSSISGITIQPSGHAGSGLSLQGVTNIVIGANNAKRTVIRNFNSNGIELNGASNIDIINCAIYNNGNQSNGNTNGILVFENSNNIDIENCYIGLDENGNRDVNNISNKENGLTISRGANNVNIIGNVISDNGPVSAAWNVSGSAEFAGVGISAQGGGRPNAIVLRDNIVGLNIDGSDDNLYGNHRLGIWCYQADDLTFENNVISGNGRGANANSDNPPDGRTDHATGLYMSEVTSSTISGNIVGLDALGLQAMPNNGNGIQLDGCTNITVENNTIGGNGRNGVFVEEDEDVAGGSGASGSNIIVRNNNIGLNVNNGPVGNGHAGIESNSNTTTIEGNIICANSRLGILLRPGIEGGNGQGAPKAFSGNNITNNHIGVLSDLTTSYPNEEGGIKIVDVNANGLNAANSGHTIADNVIMQNIDGASNDGDGFGIYIGGTDANLNLLSENIISCNDGEPIILGTTFGGDDPGNDDKQVPEISISASNVNFVRGYGEPGDIIELFRKSEAFDPNNTGCGCDAREFLTSTTIDNNGEWEIVANGFQYDEVSATARTNAQPGQNNTSPLACKEVRPAIVTTEDVCEGEVVDFIFDEHEALQLIINIGTQDLGNAVGNIIFTDQINVVDGQPINYQWTSTQSGTLYIQVTSVEGINTSNSVVYQFEVYPQPTFGVTSAAPDLVCPNYDTSNVQISGVDASHTVQWYASTDGVNFTAMNPNPGNPFQDTHDVQTWYYGEIIDDTPNACAANSDTVMIDVRDIVEPTIDLNIDNSGTCSGDEWNFSVSLTNAGPNPTINWFVNTDLRSNDLNFSPNDLVNGDEVIIEVVINDTGCVNSTVLNDTVEIDGIIDVETPMVTIIPDQSSICLNDTAIFTAIPTNGGDSPLYNWYINGNLVVGPTAVDTLAIDTLRSDDVVSVVMISNFVCLTDTASDEADTSINVGVVEVQVDITPTSADICLNEEVCFYATPANGGANPVFTWYLNGNDIQSGPVDSLCSNTFQDGDELFVMLTSDLACAQDDPFDSSEVVVINVSTQDPTINVVASTDSTCLGAPVDFVASGNNWGQDPVFYWLVNGVITDTITGLDAQPPLTLTLTDFNTGDVISASVTSSLSCAGNPIAIDTADPVVIDTNINAGLTMQLLNDATCSNDDVVIGLTPYNSGDSSRMVVYVNGLPVFNVDYPDGILTTSLLNDGDSISVVLYPTGECAGDSVIIDTSLIISLDPLLSPTFTLDKSVDVFCEDSSATFCGIDTANLGSAPIWSFYYNGQKIDEEIDPDTTYCVTLDDINDGDEVSMVVHGSYQCSRADSVVRSEEISLQPGSAINLNLSSNINDTCYLEDEMSFIFTVTDDIDPDANTNYQWLVNGQELDHDDLTYTHEDPLSGDVIAVMVTTDQRCVDTQVAIDSVTLNFSYPVEAEANQSDFDQYQLGEVIVLDGTGSTTIDDDPNEEPIYYLWSHFINDEHDTLQFGADPLVHIDYELNDEQMNEFIVNESRYRILVSNAFCWDTAWVTPVVADTFEIPNIFTPNEDGQHDVWQFRNPHIHPELEVHVFSRWGREELFTHDGSSPYEEYNAWDGTYDGEPVPAGTYYYIVNTDPHNPEKNIVRKGHVNIVR